MTTIEAALEFARREFDRAIRNEQEKFRNFQTMSGTDPARIEMILKEHLVECEAHREKSLVEIERSIRVAVQTLH
ncbi:MULTISPECIES: hypothetical protein [unclassified Bradyrhizobium]|jgi:hypothetical protein|uniref:hypothetical protein n=1 Tax=unclassified Bradyrhizobium TaxID=2631580 RepID=UPI001FF92108|nr:MULTISPECIES: hypothetical protein [unclassified Bradyrhizobium]MCK1271376.1 hypothetical protein [Bradyrhizobium sp. 84]MCK1375695.1 hypothetical protein [Bradyrhizobium sp. 49]MCK1427375.1 hypothetical protein [Bradyrhizobium sp. 87]MCK1629598.1 hypothetical protein [Bradyrhizobium sp. 162]UPJ78809.1 hypothetical protein IVB17_28665 [Bradyrhizobium sp. 184]